MWVKKLYFDQTTYFLLTKPVGIKGELFGEHSKVIYHITTSLSSKLSSLNTDVRHTSHSLLQPNTPCPLFSANKTKPWWSNLNQGNKQVHIHFVLIKDWKLFLKFKWFFLCKIMIIFIQNPNFVVVLPFFTTKKLHMGNRWFSFIQRHGKTVSAAERHPPSKRALEACC
jgi:hypothetical protein